MEIWLGKFSQHQCTNTTKAKVKNKIFLRLPMPLLVTNHSSKSNHYDDSTNQYCFTLKIYVKESSQSIETLCVATFNNISVPPMPVCVPKSPCVLTLYWSQCNLEQQVQLLYSIEQLNSFCWLGCVRILPLQASPDCGLFGVSFTCFCLSARLYGVETLNQFCYTSSKPAE